MGLDPLVDLQLGVTKSLDQILAGPVAEVAARICHVFPWAGLALGWPLEE